MEVAASPWGRSYQREHKSYSSSTSIVRKSRRVRVRGVSRHSAPEVHLTLLAWSDRNYACSGEHRLRGVGKQNENCRRLQLMNLARNARSDRGVGWSWLGPIRALLALSFLIHIFGPANAAAVVDFVSATSPVADFAATSGSGGYLPTSISSLQETELMIGYSERMTRVTTTQSPFGLEDASSQIFKVTSVSHSALSPAREKFGKSARSSSVEPVEKPCWSRTANIPSACHNAAVTSAFSPEASPQSTVTEVGLGSSLEIVTETSIVQETVTVTGSASGDADATGTLMAQSSPTGTANFLSVITLSNASTAVLALNTSGRLPTKPGSAKASTVVSSSTAQVAGTKSLALNSSHSGYTTDESKATSSNVLGLNTSMLMKATSLSVPKEKSPSTWRLIADATSRSIPSTFSSDTYGVLSQPTPTPSALVPSLATAKAPVTSTSAEGRKSQSAFRNVAGSVEEQTKVIPITDRDEAGRI